MRVFAVAAPGLEAVCRAELAALGLSACAVPGGVELEGGLLAAMRANLWSRTASRVLLRLAEFPAPGRRELVAGARRVRLADFLVAGQGVVVEASARRSRLYHTGLVAEAVLEGLGAAVPARAAAPGATGGARGVPDRASTVAPLTFLARLERDRCTLSLDTTGALLHKRGWRAEGGRAPLRETLAAGALLLAGWDPATPLCDPMCGSGTLAIEGALLSMRRAPGERRAFAFETWPACDQAAWRAMREDAAAGALPLPRAPILASDINAGALGVARRNAARAGLPAGAVLFARRDAGDCAPPEGACPGLVVANPPWGRRLGDWREARAAVEALARALSARFRGWRAAVFCHDPRIGVALGFPAERMVRLVSGGAPLTLWIGRVP